MSLALPLFGSGIANAFAASRLNQRLNRIRAESRAQSWRRGKVASARKRVFSRSRTTQGMARRSMRRRRGGRRRRRVFRPRRAPTLTPFSVVRTLKSSSIFTIDPAAAGVNDGGARGVLLALNSANDPFQTLNSTQPLGYDQLTALYNYSCVIGWKISIEFASAADDTTAIVVGFTPSTSGTLQKYVTYYKEMNGTKSMLVTKDTDRGRLFSKGSVKRWLMPRGGRILTERDFCAVSNTNPSQMLYGHVWAGPVDETTDVGAIKGTVTLSQIVVFFNPVVPARS